MLDREFCYRWEWNLRASPRELWPLVADTNRFNRDAGLPALDAASFAAGRGGRLLRFSWLGLPIEWEEQPFEWVSPSRFGVVRRYRRGPLSEIRVRVQLDARPGGGSHLSYEMQARARNWLGLLIIPLKIGRLTRGRFDAVFREYDRRAGGDASTVASVSPVEFPPGGRLRLLEQREVLLARGAEADLVDRLLKAIETIDDLDAARMRPYQLADLWGFRRRKVLELCLLATRTGLLDLQWDLLCPHCRGAKQTVYTLGNLTPQVRCESCQIDFTVNFERLVELTFRPNPAVRRVESAPFCVGGPQLTPHIVAQVRIPPADHLLLPLRLEEGRYRLRTLGLPGGQFFRLTPQGAGEAVLRASPKGWPREEWDFQPSVSLRLENDTSGDQLFILERMSWSDQAATAAEVLSLQVFRDLFATETLRPGEQISVGSLAILFTDLRGSTSLYREIGDGPAFGHVMKHFAVLKEVITAEDGAIVKTIGDAVMAVFRRPTAALFAILQAQHRLAAPPDGGIPLVLKAGIHYGPCIAVNLNDRLDYFGSTVNVAARLEGLSSGGDVVVSAAVRSDPELQDILGGSGSQLIGEPFESTLKGFGDERFELWRIALTGPS